MLPSTLYDYSLSIQQQWRSRRRCEQHAVGTNMQNNEFSPYYFVGSVQLFEKVAESKIFFFDAMLAFTISHLPLKM